MTVLLVPSGRFWLGWDSLACRPQAVEARIDGSRRLYS